MIDGVRAGGLLQPGRAVLVLYSGGRDSTCLLDVAVRIAGEGAAHALHVNYGLRADAHDDERHCAEVCEALAVPLSVRRARRPASGNLQAWAREVRYAAARELAGTSDIASGHTASDQVETILYRLASSPSRRALLGMAAQDGQLIRPLLSYTREQTTAYCLQRGLRWREDPSNEADDYARARIRGRLVPALREVHPAAERNVLAVSEILRQEAAVLEALVAEALRGKQEIELGRLRALSAPLRRLVVQQLADAAVGTPAAGVARRAEEVAEMAPNSALDLPHVRAIAHDGILRFVQRTPAAGHREPDTNLNTEA